MPAASVPLALLVHRVTVETYQGRNGRGAPVYASASAPIRAFVDHKTRMVRSSSTGQEVVSSTTVILKPSQYDAFPPGSMVTLPTGERREVIERFNRDGGTLPVPSHVELALQ